MILSDKLLKFNYFFKAFVAYIVAHATELMISPDQATNLEEDWLDWNLKNGAYTTPDTHGPVSISDINVAYEEYAPKAETIRVQIRDNSAIVLNGTDRVNLDIKIVSKSHSKILPRDFAPSIGLVKNNRLELEIFVFDSAQPAKKSKPTGVKFIGSAVAYTGADGAEPPRDAFATRVPEGKTIFSILYPTDKVGKKIWVICWYMSPTGKPSPESITFSIVLV